MRIKKERTKKVKEPHRYTFWKLGFNNKLVDKRLYRKTHFKKINNSIHHSNDFTEIAQIQMSDDGQDKNETKTNIFNSTINSTSTETTLEYSDQHVQLLKQIDILSFESDDEILSENNIDDDYEAFSSLSNLILPINITQLSVFVNYTMIHSISEPILFYLISDLYKKGSVKDMKKWAYEIFSCFIQASAPLRFYSSNFNESIVGDIESKLMQIDAYKPVNIISSSFDFEILRLLREIFQKSRFEAQQQITKQLQDFQTKRRAGLEAWYGASTADLKVAKKNKSMQQKIIEKNLMPKLLMMIEEMETEEHKNNFNRRILLSALSTVIHQTFRPSISYFASIDQFVSCGNLSSKPEICINGHRLVPKICYSSTYCDYCLKILWGLAPQGYRCKCGIKIHTTCIDLLTGTCMLNDNIEFEDETSHNESKDSSKLMEFVQATLGNQRIENYKRTKGSRPKSDPGLYRQVSDSSSDDGMNENIWNNDISMEIPKLSEIAKKRREIILELFETERRHVKVLKILHNVFYEPLKRSKAISDELADMIFPPSFLVIKDWHISFETMLKKEWHEQNGILLEIGRCVSIFEGAYGNILKENAANFCAGQQSALDALKAARRKNEPLQRALIKAESHKGCRRLQLKDLILSLLQRLTKYPLLFERISKYTEGNDQEKIKKAVESSKTILNFVNLAVKNAEEIRLIHQKLDKTQFERDAPVEFKNFNLLNYRLLNSSNMIIRKGTQSIRVLLFDKLLVFLHKTEDRYILKFSENLKYPVMKIHNIIVRSNATDNKSFYLIFQDDANSQMIELIVKSEVEAETWIRNINDAVAKANNTITLKRRSSAESAQAMLRSESKSLKKQSDLASIAKTLQIQAKFTEEWIQAAQQKMKMTQSNWDQNSLCEVDNINITVNTLNRLISQLSIKIAERDHERELYTKENLRLRELHKL
ncbi:hypothetical protein PVAND_003661 [Polypedilum vanderplanki]|uniref:Rho guanine nucleotide exchange factor n=1 Tax=Polypedilum vanderplanki TaxID=319348 RepID=A0A9J6BV97_POLVA|nr:hypothetical protein PVAND_003661 [Polypedilum vanderplanki]